MQSWDVNLLYYGRHRKSNCDELGAGFESDLYTFLAKCDVVTLNVPLTDKTRRAAAVHPVVITPAKRQLFKPCEIRQEE